MTGRRKDKHGRVLKKGEGYRKKDGLYYYRWTDENHKRQTIYASTLDELREEEKKIEADKHDGIKRDAKNIVFVELCDQWLDLKRGVKQTTIDAYRERIENQIKPYFGNKKLQDIKKSDLKRFYNYLREKKSCSQSTVNQTHAVVRQVLEMAVDDNLIRSNPADKALKELQKQASNEKTERFSLTVAQEEAFFSYIADHPKFGRWEPLFRLMVETGLRVGEASALRWCDVDTWNKVIHINHELSYCTERGTDKKRTMIQSPKSRDSIRDIPLTDKVQKLLEAEKKFQREKGVSCQSVIDGYTDFIFLSSNGNALSKTAINRALNCIVKQHNNEVKDGVELPQITSHIFRHTYATRMTEKGMHPKALQALMGHADVEITMNVYADATIDYLREEVERANTTPITTPKRRQLVPIYDNIYQLPTA